MKNIFKKLIFILMVVGIFFVIFVFVFVDMMIINFEVIFIIFVNKVICDIKFVMGIMIY